MSMLCGGRFVFSLLSGTVIKAQPNFTLVMADDLNGSTGAGLSDFDGPRGSRVYGIESCRIRLIALHRSARKPRQRANSGKRNRTNTFGCERQDASKRPDPFVYSSGSPAASVTRLK